MPQNMHLNGIYETSEEDYELGSFIIQPTDGVYIPIESRIRGLITYPKANQTTKNPLIILAHGRHSATVENFRGLSYLAHHLSSYGYICASIDLNDLVGPQGTRVSKKPPIVVGGAIFHRAKTILRTIVALKQHTLVGEKANFQKIGLIGHSRGAEAVARAGAIDVESGNLFGINAVLSIAPVDFSGTHLSLPFFLLYGDLDADVSDGQSFRVWDRASSNKHGFYVSGAIHNYFSSNWENEWESPNPRTIDRVAHENIAKSCALAFFEYYLKENHDYEPFLTGSKIPESLNDYDLSRLYSSLDQKRIDNFEGLFDHSTNSLGLPVLFEGQGNIIELDMERFKVDSDGFGNEISTYYQYHAYLNDPRYIQYYENIRAEISRMSQGFVSVMKYFFNASQKQIQIDFAQIIKTSMPNFETTTDGWLRLEIELKESPFEGLSQIQSFINNNSSALHALNQVGKGLQIEWNGLDSIYKTDLNEFDVRKYKWLSMRAGQLYNADKSPLLNPPEREQSFSITLVDKNLNTSSVVIHNIDGSIKFPKSDQDYFKSTLRTILIPIGSFMEKNPDLNIAALKELHLVFDQVDTGTLVIDDISFTN